MELLSIVADVAAVLGVPAAIVAAYQFLGKRREQERADLAEQARAHIATELAEARRELSGARRAQEQLASIEEDAARDARTVARREERQRKSQDRKLLVERKKQTKAAENLTKEAKRQGRRKK